MNSVKLRNLKCFANGYARSPVGYVELYVAFPPPPRASGVLALLFKYGPYSELPDPDAVYFCFNFL